MGSRSPDRGPVVHSAWSWLLHSVRSGAGTSSGSGGETGASWLLGLIGAALLVAYRFVPTYPPAHFGWVYAAAGGVFVILSVLWGWAIDGIAPDRFNLLGGALCSSASL